MEPVPQTGASQAEWILISTQSQQLACARASAGKPSGNVPTQTPQRKAGSCHFSFINSVCSKLYSYENNKTKAKSPGIFTLSHVVRSVYAVAQVGYAWYHKMFVI